MASCRWCTNKEIYCDTGIARLRLISHTYEDGEGDLKRRKLIEDANAEDDEGDLKRRKLIEDANAEDGEGDLKRRELIEDANAEDGEGDLKRRKLIEDANAEGDEGDLKRRKLIEDANAEDDEGDLKRRKLIEEEALRRYAQQHAERLVADWCCTCCRDVPKTEMIQLDCSTQRINECKMCNKCYYRCKKKCPCCKGNYR